MLWRGYTHITMSFMGGFIFCLLFAFSEAVKELRKEYIFIFGGLIITIAELISGTLFNLMFKMDIWDYSDIPFNFLGQICLLYSVLWCLLCIPVLKIGNILSDNFKKQRQKY